MEDILLAGGSNGGLLTSVLLTGSSTGGLMEDIPLDGDSTGGFITDIFLGGSTGGLTGDILLAGDSSGGLIADILVVGGSNGGLLAADALLPGDSTVSFFPSSGFIFLKVRREEGALLSGAWLGSGSLGESAILLSGAGSCLLTATEVWGAVTLLNVAIEDLEGEEELNN